MTEPKNLPQGEETDNLKENDQEKKKRQRYNKYYWRLPLPNSELTEEDLEYMADTEFTTLVNSID